MAREYEFKTEFDIAFTEHDGVTLLGDLYLPKGRAKAPVPVASTAAAGRSATANSTRNGGIISPETATPFLRSNTG